MRSHQKFSPLKCTFVQIFKQNGQTVKEGQRFEGYFFKKDQKYSVLTRILKKNTFKSLLFIHSLTVLAENLQKGTSEECKKFDGSGFLNFSFLAQKPTKMVIFAIFGNLTRYQQQKKQKFKNALPSYFFKTSRSTFVQIFK